MKSIKSVLLVLLVIASTSTGAFAGEPHLQQALEHLRAAKKQMVLAVYGKPGQKEKAIEAIDEAIKHVERAMK